MLTSPVSKIFATLLVIAVILGTASFATRSAHAPSVDRSYDSIEQLHAFRPSASHYDLIEQVRLGRTFNTSIDRAYDGLEGLRALRSGVDTVCSFGYDQIESLRIERGVNFTTASSYDLIEQLRNGRGISADRTYDSIELARAARLASFSVNPAGYEAVEQLRIDRGLSADDSYDGIEALRLER